MVYLMVCFNVTVKSTVNLVYVNLVWLKFNDAKSQEFATILERAKFLGPTGIGVIWIDVITQHWW